MDEITLKRWRLWLLAIAIMTMFLGFVAAWALIYDTWLSFALLACCFGLSVFFLWLLLRSGASLIDAHRLNRSLDSVAHAFDSILQEDERPK